MNQPLPPFQTQINAITNNLFNEEHLKLIRKYASILAERGNVSDGPWHISGKLWDIRRMTLGFQGDRTGFASSPDVDIQKFRKWEEEWMQLSRDYRRVKQVLDSIATKTTSIPTFYNMLPDFLIPSNITAVRTAPSLLIDPALSESHKAEEMEKLKQHWPEHLIRSFNTVVPVLAYYSALKLL